MSKNSPPDSDDDLSAWKAHLRDVAPLRGRRRVLDRPPPPPPEARQRRLDHAEVLREAMTAPVAPEDLDTGDQSSFRAPGISTQVLKRLRRGQYSIQASLDLHGKDRRQAHAAVTAFIDTARGAEQRCIKIIHGKGLRSPQGLPVLKRRVEVSLRRDNRVLAYCSAPNWLGGHGAMLVLLRKY